MRIQCHSVRRRGAVIPLVALLLVGLMGMLALTIDVGMMAIARNQCQDAADSAALAGTRCLNGDTSNSNNKTTALNTAQAAAMANNVIGQPITASNAPIGAGGIEAGDYYYDRSASPPAFTAFIGSPKTDPVTGQTDNWTLIQAKVTFDGSHGSPLTSFFGGIFGMANFTTTATAQAAHRPRDIAIVEDFSTSMKYDSMLSMPKSQARWQTMNPDPIFPQFGPYSDIANAALSADPARNPPIPPNNYAPNGVPNGSGGLGITTTSAPANQFTNDTGELADPSNLVYNVNNGIPNLHEVAWYYWTDQAATSHTFTPAPTGQGTTTPVSGDNFLYTNKNTAPNFAVTVTDVTGGGNSFDLNWELDGYAGYLNGKSSTTNGHPLYNQTDYSQAKFYGYTQGPSYWGASFMIWPPDPRLDPATETAATLNLKASWIISTAFGFTGPSDPALDPVSGSAKKVTGLYSVIGGVAGSAAWSTRVGQSLATLQSYMTTNLGPWNATTGGNANQRYEMVSRLYNRGKPAGPTGGTFSADWRARFFTPSAGIMDNRKLWNATGKWQPPAQSGGYQINYAAILAWIQQIPNGQTARPTGIANAMRSGGIKYYDSIPNSITIPPANDNERWWKRYIDETLGFNDPNDNGVYNVIVDNTNAPVTDPNNNTANCQAGIGSDWTWSANGRALQVNVAPTINVTNEGRSMDYNDNPPRWKSKGWFGGMSMMDFMTNTNLGRSFASGTSSESPSFEVKLGVQAALSDIFFNHPNDNATIAMFSTPPTFGQARVPLGRDLSKMQNSQWFALWTLQNPGQEFSCFAAQMRDVPRANGGTCYVGGLVLAFNQFSSNPNLLVPATNPTGLNGGLGRLGAQKMVIMETDGAAKDRASAAFNASGSTQQSYYSAPASFGPAQFGNAGTVTGTNAVGTAPNIYYKQWTVSGATGAPADDEPIIAQMCADESFNGFSTQRKPVLVHCIGFGSLFDPQNNSTNPNLRVTAEAHLHNFEVMGSVQNPLIAGSFYAGSIAPYKLIYGTGQQRIDNLAQAFQKIMQDNVQVTLLK